MASTKTINDAFLTSKTKNDIEIERASYKNIDRISDKDVAEIHKNLMKVFNIESNEDCKYYNVEKFTTLVTELRTKKINALKKSEEQKKKKEEKEKK